MLCEPRKKRFSMERLKKRHTVAHVCEYHSSYMHACLVPETQELRGVFSQDEAAVRGAWGLFAMPDSY